MKRDLRLDTLRGLMLVSMMVFHWPGPIRRFTHEPVGFVSAAEGFVFLSGLIAGLVFVRFGQRYDHDALRTRSLRRARDIYLAHVIPLALVWLAARAVPGSRAFWGNVVPHAYSGPWFSFVPGALMLYQPMFFDILPMYVVFVLFIPLVIRLLTAGRWKAVLLTSAGLWVLSQFGIWRMLEHLLGTVMPVDLGTFDPFAWQLLFVGGLALGHWWLSYRGPSVFTHPVAVPVVAGIAGLLFLVRYRILPLGTPILWDNPLVGLSTLAPLRLLNFTVLAYLVGFAAVRFRRLFSCRWLSFLGQHSLQVFTFHVIVVYAGMPLFERIETLSPAGQIGITVAVLLSLTIPAWAHREYRRWRSASSVMGAAAHGAQ